MQMTSARNRQCSCCCLFLFTSQHLLSCSGHGSRGNMTLHQCCGMWTRVCSGRDVFSKWILIFHDMLQLQTSVLYYTDLAILKCALLEALEDFLPQFKDMKLWLTGESRLRKHKSACLYKSVLWQTFFFFFFNFSMHTQPALLSSG